MARPNDSTTAYIGFSLLIINDVDIDEHTFKCTGWFTVLWNDDRLRWTPSTYDDTYYIHALETEIWKPEVLVVNANEDVGLLSDDHLIYRIRYTGDVEWEPLMTYTVYCEIDATYFPFDRQKCELQLTSWGLPENELKLKKLWEDVSLDSYRENSSWDIEGYEVTEARIIENVNGTAESFSQLIIKLKIRRRPGNYVINVMIPIFLTSYLLALSYLIPVVSGERMTSCFLALAVIVLLLSINLDQIPDIEITTSIMSIYLCVGFCIDIVSVAVTTILVKLHHQDEAYPVGKFHCHVVKVLKRLTFYKDPPLPPSELELLKIPTDDLRKIERCPTPSNNKNAVNPILEDGFTEHVKVREDTLPALDSILLRVKSAKSRRNEAKEAEMEPQELIKKKMRKMTMKDAIVVWDRAMFALFILMKTAYNMILIANIVSDYSKD